MFKSRRGGFTLLELLIVIIILGILAAVGIPVYTGTLEKARAKEALNTISAIKDAQARHFMEYGVFDVIDPTPAYTASAGNLDTSWNTRYWNFATTLGGAIIATRVSGTSVGQNITLTITSTNYQGTWTGTHPAAPTTL